MNNGETRTTAQLRTAAREAAGVAHFREAAELFDLAADRYPDRQGELGACDIDRLRSEAKACREIGAERQSDLMARLLTAAENVVWFDWTGNDSDSVAAINNLRDAIARTRNDGGSAQATKLEAAAQLRSAREHGMDLDDSPVAYELFNAKTGHAIVDYSRWTYVGHLTEANGYEARPLVYAGGRATSQQASAQSGATPGPWERTAVDGGWDGVKEPGGQIICKLVLNVPENADLIAAAHDMLAVLLVIVRVADGRTTPGNLILDENSPIMGAARAAIAKATGAA